MFQPPNDEEQEKYKQFFIEADANGDGSLSFEELLEVFRKQGYPANHAMTLVRTIFARCDADPDGNITFEQYAKGFKLKVNPKLAEYRRVFDEIDKDGNGELDMEEIEELFIKLGIFVSDRELNRLFAIVDTDKNGTISFQEFVHHICGEKAY